MNYKKMSLRALMLGFMAVLFAGFTSCSSSDDDENKTVEENNAPTSGVLSCSFEPSEDELALCNITAEYTDASGKIQTEEITGKWEKKITFTTLPTKVSVTLKHSLKANVELSKESYHFGGLWDDVVYAIKKDGSKYWPIQMGPRLIHNNAVGKAKVEDFITRTAVLKTISYTISNKPNEDGSYIY